ncbi:MAG TPA: hypothetical protein VKG44_08485, partial [Candidatus Baltobacteraceae bacterium]|nr:hypothetical protein [Candidatus Baltobacteraceae bacterium]
MAAAVLLAGIFATRNVAQADPSDGLKNVLSQIRGLSSYDFSSLRDWANKGGTATPFSTSFQPGKVEADILALGSSDRNAVVSWLQGHGRSALYAQGASDSDIGPTRPGFDAPAPTPSPNAWRSIPLATATLDDHAQGNIQILGGFAAVKRDGTAAIACLSFKNLDTKVAKRVVFEFPLLGDNGGGDLGKLVLDRTGEFSPNIDIRSYESMQSWQTPGSGPRTLGDGCILRELPTA